MNEWKEKIIAKADGQRLEFYQSKYLAAKSKAVPGG